MLFRSNNTVMIGETARWIFVRESVNTFIINLFEFTDIIEFLQIFTTLNDKFATVMSLRCYPIQLNGLLGGADGQPDGNIRNGFNGTSQG